MNQQEIIIQSAKEQIVFSDRKNGGWNDKIESIFTTAVQYTLENLWISTEEEKPESCKLVFAALLDVKTEAYQYYVGWYNETQEQWFLADFGYCFDVSYWMPIPTLISPADLPF